MQALLYDAVLAVTDTAVNTGFSHVFSSDPEFADMEIDVDPDHGVKMTGTFAPPSVQFMENNQAKITVPIVSGTYYGPKEVNEQGTIDQEVTKLDGSALGFTVDVVRLERKGALIHEADFTIAQLYLDMSSIAAIDTAAFPVAVTEAADVSKIIDAWVEKQQKMSPSDQKPLLSTGHIAVPEVFDPAGSPLLPSHGQFSTTLVPSDTPGPRAGDLNYLLMMGGRGVNSAAAGQFATPWNAHPTDGGAPAHDGSFVLSDFMLLEALAVPILKNSFKFPDDAFAVTRSPDGHGALTLTKPVDLGDDVTLTGCTVTVDQSGTGNMVFTLNAQKDEKLQIAGVDISLIELTIPQIRTITLQVVTDAKGNLDLKFVSDHTQKLDAKPSANLDVKQAADIVKYVLALPMLVLGPILGPIYVAVLAASEGLAQGIKSATTDESEVSAALDKLETSMRSDLNMAAQLPGSAVLSFSNMHFQGALLTFDADYIEMPALDTPDNQPFSIPGFPKMSADSQTTPKTTDPVLVGEALVSYRMVDDPDYAGRQVTDCPYYILKREQYWSQQYLTGFAPHTTISDTASWRIEMSKEDTTSMSQTASMRVTAGCRLAFDDYISAEAQSEIAHELRIDTDTTTRDDTEQSFSEQITHESTDATYTVAMWTIVDRFTLMRGVDRYPIKSWEYVHGEDEVQVDVWPSADGPPTGSGFDSESFEASLGNGHGNGKGNGQAQAAGQTSAAN